MVAPTRADPRLAALLQAQHGLVSRQQAFGLGHTNNQIQYRLRRGEWIRVERSVYRHHLFKQSWEARLLAPCLAVGALASHRSAACLWRLDGFSRVRPEVVVPKGASIDRTDVRVHNTTLFDECEPRLINGIPTTGIERTLIDLAKVVSYKKLRQAVDSARLQELVTWPDVGRAFSTHARRGRNGIAKMRLYLEDHLGEESIPLSDWSRLVADLLVDGGLPVPTLEHEVIGPGFRYKIDLAYPEVGLGLELDSASWHLNRKSFEKDRQRLNALQNLGWSMRLFTWSDFSMQPAQLVQTVRQAHEQLTKARNVGRHSE